MAVQIILQSLQNLAKQKMLCHLHRGRTAMILQTNHLHQALRGGVVIHAISALHDYNERA